MVKYKLSKNAEIAGFENYDIAKIPEQYNQGFYVLKNKTKDKEYIINETIKYFIQKFSSPKTFQETLKSVEIEMQNSSPEIKETCALFFKILCDKKILIPEKEEEINASSLAFYKVGDAIGNVTVVKLLSQNQYLEVYLVYDKTDGKNYVIKLLNRNKTPDEIIFQQEYAELYKEFSLQKNFQHVPCICKAYQLVRDNFENPFIILECITGKSLSHYLRDFETLSQQDSLQIIGGILHAFSIIHKNKIIHGDIHASNILIDDDNKIKIIDLGLSHTEKAENNEVLIFGGVNFYMPPERINISSLNKYAKAPNAHSDVYQLGLIMYKILYNDLPFDGFIWEELSKNIKEGKINYPAISFSGFIVPDGLINIIKRSLSLNADERYTDASAILKDYKKYFYRK